MRCPYVYPDGKRCDGHIKELEWIGAWGPYALLSENGEMRHLGWFTAHGGYILLHCSQHPDTHRQKPAPDLSGIPDVMKIQDDDVPINIQLQLLKYGFKDGRAGNIVEIRKLLLEKSS